MKKLVLFVGFSLLIVLPAVAENMAIEDWYQNSYAVLFEESPWDKVSAVADHYDTKVHRHSPQESQTAIDRRDGDWLFTEYAEIDCAEHNL